MSPFHHVIRRVAACAVLSASGTAFAVPTLTVLHAFSGDDGQLPHAGLVTASNGNLYGTTFWGGTAADCTSCGTLFSITPKGKFKSLYSFGLADGALPDSPLIQGTDGLLHGTADQNGTPNTAGTLFSFTLKGVYSLEHQFTQADAGGGVTNSPLQTADGSIYGTNWGGVGNVGTVYRLAQDGTYTTLHAFDATGGYAPRGGLTLGQDGAFYGTTTTDGTPCRCGTVFRMTPDGALTTIHQFATTDGAKPVATLALAADGNLYGTTAAGGANNMGTIFRISPAGAFITLHSFSGVDGSAPASPLAVGSQGRQLYGTTPTGGGSTACTNGCGTVFEITLAGVFSTLHAFSSTDGSGPSGALALPSTGVIYGTTVNGGPNRRGEVYRLTTH